MVQAVAFFFLNNAPFCDYVEYQSKTGGTGYAEYEMEIKGV